MADTNVLSSAKINSSIVRMHNYKSILKILVAVVVILNFDYILSHILIILLLCSIFIWVSFLLSSYESSNKETRLSFNEKYPRFKFVNEIDWQNLVQSREEEEEALFPQSFLISESIDNILEFILRDFIKSWYKNITQDDDKFPKQLKLQLRLAIQKLTSRLEKIDISDLIVLKLIPTVTDHFNNYVFAEEVVLNKRKQLQQHDFDSAVVSNFNARKKLHRAIKLKNLSYENDRKTYLQDSIESILPYLISTEELASAPVRILLKNIVTSCVVFPSISMLCDLDFWNQIIVNSIGAVLKDRYQVRKFRSVLDLHSNSNQKHKLVLKNDYSQNSLMKKQLLTTKSSQQQFDKIIKRIDKAQSIPELKQLRYYTSLQLSKSVRQLEKETVVQDDLKQYNKRLQLLKLSIDGRLARLLDPSASSTFNNISSESNKPFKPESLPKNSKLNLSLNDIITNPASLAYFMEFMEQRSRTVLLQFWLTINGIRSPLEDLTDYEDLESDDEELIAMSLSLDLSQSDDIESIYEKFFQERLLKLDPLNYANVARFVESQHKSLDLYVKARKSLLILQKETYNRMEKTDFVAFKDSDLFLRLLATEDLFTGSRVADLDILSDEGDEEDDDDEDYEDADDPMLKNDKVGDNVIKAVEDALNEIMIDEKNNSRSESDLPSRGSSLSLAESVEALEDSKRSPSELQREIFGSEDNLFGEMESSIFSNQKRSSRLFDDDMSDSEVETSETASNFENELATVDLDNNEVQLAAPGDLNLAEQITKLSGEIGRYESQVSIIDPLLRKAEITNNVAELKILRKSKLSLEREIELKELQKQQYIVQENDNSLFGKSRVRIQSYVPEKNYIFYIIEVQKLSGDNSDVVTAGWIVPRRFSQFYKLNEYLKLKYPVIQDLLFPKRKVVLKFQQTALIEERKNQLELYLQELIKIPEVCSNKLFRSFLSSEVFAMELNNSLNSSTKMSRRAKVESVANKFYSTLSSRVPLSAGSIMLGNRFNDKSPPPALQLSSAAALSSSQILNLVDDQVNDMQKELNSFDEVGKMAFVRPICDLIISIFSLKKSNAWLRGRAILVVLQQFLGSTIEKKVRDNLNFLFRTETKILDLVVILRDKLWPDGKFRERGKPRTVIEKSSTKTKSKMLLEKFLIDSTSRIFGVSNSKFASSKIHAMLQNELILNNLIFSLYDNILEEVFPEIVDL